MNKTQLQTTIAPLIGVLAGYLAGAHVLDLSAGDWTIVISSLLGVGAILWPAVVTRAQSLKDTVGKMPATTVVTDKASADALPNNPDVVAATPQIAAAVQSSILKTVMNVLLVAFVLSAFLAGAPAMAQAPAKKSAGPVFTGDLVGDAKNHFQGDPSTGVQLTGNLKKDAQAVWDKIVSASNVDLKYASQLAANANTPASAVRKQCWDEILATNEQANGMNLKNADGTPMALPDPKLFTQIEQAAEVIDALSPQGKLYTSCAGAAQLVQANVIQFISAAVTGVAGLAKLSPIPGL